MDMTNFFAPENGFSDFMNGAGLQEFVAFDIETNGFSRTDNEILSVGATRFINGKPVSSFYSLTKSEPHVSVPYRISQITGITQAMMKDAPREEEVLPCLLAFFGDSPIVGYNSTTFDFPFLEAKLIRNSLPLLDSVKKYDALPLARARYPKQKNNLSVALEREGITLKNAHNALEDATATGHLYHRYVPAPFPSVNSHNEFSTSMIPQFLGVAGTDFMLNHF